MYSYTVRVSLRSIVSFSHYSHFTRMYRHTASFFTIRLLHILLSHVWYNIIISLNFYCKGEAAASFLPFYLIVALRDDGREYRPKHVAVNAMNK